MAALYKRVRHHVETPCVAQRYISTWSDKRVEREYKKCRELEEQLQKQYKAQIKAHSRIKATYSLDDLQQIVNNLCDRLGCRKTIVVQLPPQDYRECSHYDGKHIVMACYTFTEQSIKVLLHELAHHIMCKEKDLIGHSNTSTYHDNDYLWVLQMLYEAHYRI